MPVAIPPALLAQQDLGEDWAQWLHGLPRLTRELLDEWKALPRIDRATDDALWRRFSTARTAYTRRRKAHFSEQHEKRDAARAVKERLATEAEELAGSTDWGPTAGRYRDLMRDWKAAGPAPKSVDDALWKRFRGAQDQFFGARDAANAEQDREFAENAETKKAILVEAEALLPVTDLDAAKRAFRDLADRWDAAGKVPRDQIKTLEGRMRKVEPLTRALAGYEAWVTGVRREESVARAGTPVVTWDAGHGLVKVNPLAAWTSEQVEEYAATHHVLSNPLLQDGYPSIGCAPCTRRVAPGEDARAGRWSGTEKTECGIHGGDYSI